MRVENGYYIFSTDEDVQLSTNFNTKSDKLYCRSGKADENRLSVEIIEVAQKIRDYTGRPVHVNSAYRTEDYNKQIGGAPNSQHVKGNALDIRVDDVEPWKLAIIAGMCGARGVGLYKNFVHIDVRKAPMVFKGAY